QWRQISLPCNPGANNTVTAVFGDDIPGTYGTEWILYRYDASGYVPLDATSDTLSQGVGYWIIQKSGSETTLDMPDNSAPTPTPIFKACPEGCFNIPLATQANATQWNMIGYPFVSSGSLGDVRVRPDSGSYSSVYNLDDAQPLGLVHSQLWTYNGSGYTAVDTSGNLDAWKGYWVSTLENADDLPLSLLVPKP
ncbi:MAG: hypothetical protein KAG66_19830, partial [Methylococcales bacterium]|nr:hypothetical protein [Methylococcales bacterium]